MSIHVLRFKILLTEDVIRMGGLFNEIAALVVSQELSYPFFMQQHDHIADKLQSNVVSDLNQQVHISDSVRNMIYI